ncbi:hypothetical protein SAMN05660909_02087 [Chitinophaga terrae (ex Kim and Jung 2007)]|jgi:methylphosphotriester-DNA--protein-cysteine methyltransferase|uniref:HTH araC/xylS-type domain-containing protein n=1 Tax=Chitinophaga terrae (ex Kim and Jung 2007) TaxID=408074 RepID=A0A1H4BIU3_9BACT|nr:DUF6597 domain-containing transcriptional factor [Chitinophaga terrae (ex Kim and Jung 2007)]MDQ0109339.1 methylphosphotriester-DNA--protein-cysteine methyltransferase [Chitinophaga terrae (ex Kim and Jung 2007)]GEP89579.1 hypothetical protein CTE07_12240 [Chitinophaga terrae (ex Kim and Jung 2007)]SEA47948.1 hypothetical protein SAMN05660909_02087 [Chitinophaga terrae (ex Kim and Jung 2007)]
MNFHIYHPADALRPFVKQYYYWEDNTRGTIQIPQNLFALGDQYLILMLEGKGEVKPATHKAFTLTGNAILGHLTCACQFQVEGPVKVAVVQLNPYGCFRLLGLQADSFTNYYRNLDTLNSGLWTETANALREMKDMKEVETILDKACITTMESQCCSMRTADDMADYMLIRQGNVSLQELSERYQLSKPTLERIFTAVIGLPPLLYARMIRYKTALRALRQLNLPEWQLPVAATAYYNQAMFIEDYLQFNHQTPSYFTPSTATIAQMPAEHQQVAVAS